MTWTWFSARSCRLAAALTAALPLAVRAQTVRGVVLDAGERPIPGVVVLLLDSTSSVTARALSDQRGEFRLAAPRAGTYRVRTLRIGFRPVVSPPMTLAAGAEVARRLVLTGLPISLDTIRVVDRNVCRAFTDSGAATYAVWEQIRTALTAAQLTAAARTIFATTIARDQTVGARPGVNEGKVLDQSAVVQTGYVTQPWRAVGADTLRRLGYMYTERNASIVYYAPDLDVLLSSIFVEDHCFKLVYERRRGDRIGIAFEPSPDRRNIAEIRGTIWVDRASSELRRLEFRYTHVAPEQEQLAGGDIDFARMRDGTWAISSWNIRMPLLEQVLNPSRAPEIRPGGIKTTGGSLILARRGADTLWMAQPLVLSGRVVDSASGDGIAGARVQLAGTSLAESTDARGRFSIRGVLPGQYDVEIRTASLDSMATSHRTPLSFADAENRLELRVPNASQLAAAICGATRDSLARGPGIILGRARLRDDSTGSASAARNVVVIAEWGAASARHDDTTGAVTTRRLQASTTADGSFRVCGLPLNTMVSLRATADSAETVDVSSVRIPSSRYLARAELTLDRLGELAARGAVFTGIVITDSTRAPIIGAEVALPELGKSTVTDARGAFRITGIPAGEHQIVVRRLGYGAADTRVKFEGHETVERRVVLGRAVMLEPVTISDRAIARSLESFEENRRVGLGHFLTRAEIAKYDGMTLRTVLEQVPDVRMVNGRTESAWVTSRRAPAAMCPTPPPRDPLKGSTSGQKCLENHGYYVPFTYEAAQGMVPACYALVYVDGALMNGIREPVEPFDVSTIAPERIEAIEFYAGAAQTPLKYSRMGSNCGVLVIWTRRAR